MAVTKTCSNHYKYMLMTGEIDLDSHTIKAILLYMNGTAFDKDVHDTLANITAYQLATSGGYVQNDEALSKTSVTEDDTNDRATGLFANVTFTAVGGSIGPFDAVAFYDDTTSDDTLISCIELGASTTLSVGQSYQFATPDFRIY